MLKFPVVARGSSSCVQRRELARGKLPTMMITQRYLHYCLDEACQFNRPFNDTISSRGKQQYLLVIISYIERVVHLHFLLSLSRSGNIVNPLAGRQRARPARVPYTLTLDTCLSPTKLNFSRDLSFFPIVRLDRWRRELVPMPREPTCPATRPHRSASVPRLPQTMLPQRQRLPRRPNETTIAGGQSRQQHRPQEGLRR